MSDDGTWQRPTHEQRQPHVEARLARLYPGLLRIQCWHYTYSNGDDRLFYEFRGDGALLLKYGLAEMDPKARSRSARRRELRAPSRYREAETCGTGWLHDPGDSTTPYVYHMSGSLGLPERKWLEQSFWRIWRRIAKPRVAR